MFEKIKELLFTTKEKKVMLSEDAIKEALSKISNENELRWQECMSKLKTPVDATQIALQAIMEDKGTNKFFEDVQGILGRKERSIIAKALEASVCNKFELVDFQFELHEAASSKNVNDTRSLESLLKDGANPNELSLGGRNTPLHEAILRENLPAIKLLLEYGADLFRANRKGVTPYDLSYGKALVEGLFLSDKETNFRVRVQVLNRNLEKLDKYGLSQKLGNLNAYGRNVESTIKECYPASTLKELCISKVLNCIEGEHNK